MKKIIVYILSVIMLVSLVHAADNLYFSLVIKYNSGQLSKQEVKLIQSSESLELKKDSGEYKLIIKSDKDITLFETYFDLEKEIIFSPLKEWFNNGGEQVVIPTETQNTELKETSVVLFTPYFKNANTINIYDKNNDLKLSIDVGEFTDSKKSSNGSWWQRFIQQIKGWFK